MSDRETAAVREWLAASRPGPDLNAPLDTEADIQARSGAHTVAVDRVGTYLRDCASDDMTEHVASCPRHPVTVADLWQLYSAHRPLCPPCHAGVHDGCWRDNATTTGPCDCPCTTTTDPP